jgi:MFS transporter, ACS family, D-galactonate transporter
MLVCLLGLGVIVAYIDRFNLSFALASPEFKSYFQLTDYQRGLVNSAFFWSYTAMQIPAGYLVDRFGVRIPLTFALLAWSLIAAATSMASALWELVALRLLLGVAESVMNPGGLSWIRLHMNEQERGMAVGIFMSGTKWGPALAGPLATWLLTQHGWRTMFLVLGAGGAVWVIPWLFATRRDNVALVPDAPPAQSSGDFGRLFLTPQMWGTLIGTFCYNYFLFFALTWLPAYFTESRNLTLSSSGVYTFFSFTGTAVLAIVAGWVADRLIRRGRNPVNVRRYFTVAGLVWASTEIVGAMSESNDVAIFFAVFSTIGLGLATANYWALTQTLMPDVGAGKIGGVQGVALNLAGIVAPIVTGWLKEVTGSYTAPMQAMGVILLIGIGSYLFLIREPVAPARIPSPHPDPAYTGNL